MKKIIALCLLMSLFSCEESKEVETITVKNKYSIQLPAFLSKSTTLHEDATLQYENIFKELYVIIIEEPKLEFAELAENIGSEPNLNGYYDILTSGLEETIEDVDFTDIKDTQINGLKAKTFAITGKVDDIEAYYKMAYVEGKTSFYQIVTWTGKSNKDDFSETMTKMLTSFKEIGTNRGKDRSK